MQTPPEKDERFFLKQYITIFITSFSFSLFSFCNAKRFHAFECRKMQQVGLHALYKVQPSRKAERGEGGGEGVGQANLRLKGKKFKKKISTKCRS